MSFVKIGVPFLTLVTLTFTAIGFSVSNWPELRKAIHPKTELDVVFLESDSHIVLANRGDAPLFVARARIELENGPGPWQEVAINAVVPNGTFYVWQRPDEPEYSGEKFDVVRGLSSLQFRDEVDAGIGDSRCYRFSFHDFNSIRRYALTYGGEINRSPARISILYMEPNSKDVLETAYKATMMLSRIHRVECSAKYGKRWMDPRGVGSGGAR